MLLSREMMMLDAPSICLSLKILETLHVNDISERFSTLTYR